MKKMILTLIVFAFISSLCFVQQPSTKADEVKTFTGKIESFTKLMGKPPKWIYGKFTFVADSGENIIIYVIKATAVADVSGNDMTEAGKKLGALFLKKGERIEVNYSIIDNGRNEAISIRCLD